MNDETTQLIEKQDEELSCLELLDETIAAQDIDIWWGAYLGMPHEALVAGPLTEVAAKIVSDRAALRAEHGWIMDTYLLRRRSAA